MIAVLKAIDSEPDMTLEKISNITGFDEMTVTALIAQAMKEGVGITKTGAVYTLEHWGPRI
ncbi:hypothetical protein GC387_22975 [Pseudomonas sp. MWU12-2323]|nr:hypothetical protein [Pseudomonas sp. MWU12-2323]MPQ69475.1 hypothetical protein [Pseudomonas sp. MWU12-2323]